MQRERELLYTPFRADLVCVCLTQARLHKAWGVVPHKGHWKKRADMKSVIHFFCIFSYSSRIFSYVFCEFSFGDSLSLFYANFFISFPPFFFLSRLKEREICPEWMKQETMSQRFSSGKFAKRIKRQKGWSWLFLFETLSRIVCCFRFFKKNSPLLYVE